MSTQLKILVGFIFTLLTCIPLAAIGVNDLGRDFSLVSVDEQTVMEQRAAALAGRNVEVGADLFGQYCYSCHGKRGEGLPSVAPAINRKDLFDGRREKEIGWAGSVEGFIRNSIAAGRPVSSRADLYSAKMPIWGQEFGGPLRTDQVNSLVAYVLNWQSQAPEVQAWPPAATPGPAPTAGPSPTPAPTKAGVIPQCQNMPAQFASKKSPYKLDDKTVQTQGKAIYDAQCAACHGSAGRGDGAAAAALNPKPANFTDKTFMQGMPVECHFWRISEGGGVGSPMPPWKTSLTEDQIWKVLIYERSWTGVQ